MSADYFVLPNGVPLTYGFPEDRGGPAAWWKTQYSPRFLKPLRKQSLPKLALWPRTGNLVLIVADIDVVPDGYSSFRAVTISQMLSYEGRCIGIETPSGKSKVLYLMDTGGHPMSDALALYGLQQVLPPDLYAAIDKCSAALRQAFLTPAAVDLIHSELPTLLPALTLPAATTALGGLGADTDVVPCPSKRSSLHEYRRYTGSIDSPALLRFGRTPARDAFLRVLLDAPMLREAGFDLPTTSIARCLKISNQAVGQFIKELQRTGLLKCIDEAVTIGSKARTFLAAGELREALLNRFPPLQPRETLPERIPNGAWHRTLYAATFHFSDFSAFRGWAIGLPGLNAERLRKVDRLAHMYGKAVDKPVAASAPLPVRYIPPKSALKPVTEIKNPGCGITPLLPQTRYLFTHASMTTPA